MNRYAAFALFALFLACASQTPESKEAASALSSGRGYTLVNLHPDDQRSRLFAVNYQQAGLIPVCTEVEYLGLGRKSFKFRVVAGGREYEYFNHKAAAEPFPTHVGRFFGPSCPQAELDSLSAIDKRGIKEGRALPGMSRRGVVLAMGHPPRHVNPDANAATYMYWTNRFNRLQVIFGDDNRVTEVRD
jgi:hypothetical protein